MSNQFLKHVLSGLRDLFQMEHSRARKEFIKSLIEDQKSGMDMVDSQIFAAKMIGVRNPAFDGDMIGYPDDDFRDDDDDEDDNNERKKSDKL
jgi:hypothetical protein